MVWVVAGIVVAVVAIGAFVAYRLTRPADVVADTPPASSAAASPAQEPGPGPADASDTPSAMPAGQAGPAVASSVLAATPAPLPEDRQPSATMTVVPEPASAPAPAPVPVPVPVPKAQAPAAVAVAPAAGRPPELVPPRREPAPAAANTRDMGGVAAQLAQAGEADFNRQDYSSAIANAKAALAVDPANRRAQRLLREAQAAQQKAMNSISIQ